LIWATLMTLWLPWFDSGSGYRSLLSSLRAALPADHGPVASIGLGESERAMLEYYAGVKTRRIEVNNDLKGIDLLLVESGGKQPALPDGRTWRLIWEGTRPGGKKPKEVFRLFRSVKE
jgi:hypothetical protein